MRKIFTSLADVEFNRLFADFNKMAFRLETLQHYDVSYEADEFKRFLAGEERGRFPGISEWIENTVRPAVQREKIMQRVHVVELPLSDYVKFECSWAYTYTTAAGEGVRILPIEQGTSCGIPQQDFWLFDSKRLVTMHYDSNGVFLSAELTDDHAAVEDACHWSHLALAQSIPYRKFAEQHRFSETTSDGHPQTHQGR